MKNLFAREVIIAIIIILLLSIGIACNYVHNTTLSDRGNNEQPRSSDLGLSWKTPLYPNEVLAEPQDIKPILNNLYSDFGIRHVNIDFSNPVLAYTALLEDSFIYLGTNETSVSYYRAYFTGETILIGHIPGFYLNMKQSVLLDSKLHVFVSIFNYDVQGIENILVCINLSDNTLMQYRNYDGSIAGVPTYAFDGNLLALKNVVDLKTITSFVEKVDVYNNNWQRLLTYTIDKNTNIGSTVLGLCSDSETICVLCYICSGHDNAETFLKVFDRSIDELMSIRIEDDIHDYVLTSFIADMQLYGEYIYIYNASNYGFLGRIVNGKLHEVYRGRNFELSQSHSGDSPLFYTRRTNTVFTIDNENNSLNEYKMQLGEDYSIMTILSTDKTALIICYADDKADFAYLVNRGNISNVILPCK